jgi:homoserine O-acetyltransferase
MDSASRWRQVDALYHAARERAPEARAAFLAGACGNDEALRREVESLLAQPVSVGGVLDGGALAVAPPLASPTESASLVGRRLGVYQVLGLIGAGGMGEVYRARDTRLGRDVALNCDEADMLQHHFRLARVTTLLVAATLIAATSTAPLAAQAPAVVEGDFRVRDYRFRSGEALPEVRLHYRTLGTPRKGASGVVENAVLILHGTGGTGAQFLGRAFADELFGPGQLLDVSKHFIVLPDGLGHGQSSKPSDGLRAKFPRYGYLDMVDLHHRLLVEGLGVTHARLVMGTSMGGMQTWIWGQQHPTFMDALMPLASVPTQISGRNRVWRRLIIDAIRNDPGWNSGDYTTQPKSLRTVQQMIWLVGSNPARRYRDAPTLADADRVMEQALANSLKNADANDILYQYESSRDYDPGPGLEKIQAPLVAVNSADDIVNPPEIGMLEKEIIRVKRGRAVMLPYSDRTAGHGTHTLAAVWKHELETLLKQSAR